MSNSYSPIIDSVVDGAPEDEIEITPEMIEAGFRVLCNSGIAESYLRADKTLVAEIFRVMLAGHQLKKGGQ